MAPSEHFDPNEYNSSTLEIIAYSDYYDEAWPTFDANQMDAYKAISTKITNGLTNDIRAVYYTDRSYIYTYMLNLITYQESLEEQVSSTCDKMCFDSVYDQIQNELAIISYLNPWVDGYASVYEATCQQVLNWLASANSMLEMQATSIVKAASSQSTTWLSLLASSLNLAGGFCPPPCATVFKSVSILLSMSVSMATSSASKATNTAADNSLDLEYSELIATTESFYYNLTAMVDDQTQAITSNWGKLQAWVGLIYPTNTTVTSPQIGQYLNATDSALQYQAYEWLFPSKYQICMQVTDCYHPMCTNSGSCCSDQNYHYCTASQITSTKKSKNLGTEGGSEQDCTCDDGCGCCKWNDKTCNVNAFMWMCELGNVQAGPPSAVYNVLNSNTYAASENLIQNSDFLDTVLDGCLSNWNQKNCSSAGMMITVDDIGECTDHWETSSCGDGGHCNAFSY